MASGLRAGFLHLLGGSLLGRALSFAFNLLLTRSLGPANLGLLNLLLSATQALEMTVRGGIDFAIVYLLTGRRSDEFGPTDPTDPSVSFVPGQDEGGEDAQVVALADQRASTIHTALWMVQMITVLAALLLWIWVMPLGGLLPRELPLPRSWLMLALLVFCVSEGLGSLHWDLMLVHGRTALLALRQGLFAPLKVGASLLGALLAGLAGTLVAYGMISVLQMLWLQQGARWLLPHLKPSQLRFEPHIAARLIRLGAPMYLTNLLSALVFLPLLGSLAHWGGIADVGYLRVGQIVVQLFTLLPGALVPVLFVRLRRSDDLASRQRDSERSLRALWWSGLACLLSYLLVDGWVVPLVFGSAFLSSLQASRVLVLAAVAESISQVLHQPLLASRHTRLYFLVQNGAALLAALVGGLSIPSLGVGGFLAAKLVYSLLPLLAYLQSARPHLADRAAIDRLLLITLAMIPLCWLGGGGSARVAALGLVVLGPAMVWEGWQLRQWLSAARPGPG